MIAERALTALTEVRPDVWVKAEYEHPTGSFKDRGARAMIGTAAQLGVRRVVADSSGNAGRAVAAACAAAGMDCTVFLPDTTEPSKLEAITSQGARAERVPGGRAAAARAAQSAAHSGAWYASHVHQPTFHHGVKAVAGELWSQGMEGNGPDPGGATVVVPAGNGTLVLGLWLGFTELYGAGRLGRVPRLIAVQADGCSPLVGRHSRPLDGPPTSAIPIRQVTSATGIAIADPPRSGQIRAALAASGGMAVTVNEDAIAAAVIELNRIGHPVEPTGAVAWAALEQIPAEDGPVIAILTGRRLAP